MISEEIPESAPNADRSAGRQSIRFGEAFWVWVRIGLTSFGGPAGQIALMHRVLVEERRWISENRFLHALNYCMLLPGPEAQQLATYVGWLLHRTAGGLVAGVLFVLPGAIVMLILSILYAGYRDVTIVEAAFFGIKAAVLAVVIDAVLRIGRRALKNKVMVALAAAAFVAIFFFSVPFPVIVVAAGLLGLLGARILPRYFVFAKEDKSAGSRPEDQSPAAAISDEGSLAHTNPDTVRTVRIVCTCLLLWFGPIIALALWLGPSDVFVQESLFFSKMAVVTFGGAYAVLAYVAQQTVETYGWLAPGEMLDGLGMAETTPGPLIMVVQFVGFMAAYRNPGMLDPMLAGTLGAALTTWVTFVPCFLWILVGAPYIEALRGNRFLSAALSAITAAVVGVILNLAVWFGLHVSFETIEEIHLAGFRLFSPEWQSADPATLCLTAAALLAMLKFKVGMIPTLIGAALLGALYHYAAV